MLNFQGNLCFFFVVGFCGPKAWHLYSGQALAQNFWSHEAPKTAVALNTRAGGPTWRPMLRLMKWNLFSEESRIYHGFIHDLSRIYYVFTVLNTSVFCWILFLMPDSLTVTWWICFSVDVLEVVPNMSLEQGHVWDVWPEFAHTGSIHFSFQSILGHWINLHWNMMHAAALATGRPQSGSEPKKAGQSQDYCIPIQSL